MAGLRTNALVAVGATLFVLLSAYGFRGATADPTRVAAQIVSGIGFLGAGVILRDGLNVRGLNTAATLWCSAAVGAGMFTVALAGTALVVVVNVALRAAGRVVDRRPDTGDERPTFYTFVAVTRDEQEAHVRALLVQALTRTEFRVRSIASSNTGTNGHVEVRAELVGDQRDDRQMESAVSRASSPRSPASAGPPMTSPKPNRQIPDPTAVGAGVVSRLTLDQIQI